MNKYYAFTAKNTETGKVNSILPFHTQAEAVGRARKELAKDYLVSEVRVYLIGGTKSKPTQELVWCADNVYLP